MIGLILISIDPVITRLRGPILILAYAAYLIILVRGEIKIGILDEPERLGICWRCRNTPLVDSFLLVAGPGLTSIIIHWP